MIQSPKQNFLERSNLVKAHADTVDSEPFLEASKAAMLQMIADSPDDVDPSRCLAAYHRIIGARTFLRILQTIGDKTAPVEKPRVMGTLDHNA